MIPNALETIQTHLFNSVEVMTRNNVPEVMKTRILRLRDIYSFWLTFPSKKDAEIVMELKKRYQIQSSQAYDDLKVIKQLLGDLNKASTDFHRWKFNNMIQRAYDLAELKKDPKSMVAAADKYAKYNKLNQEDAEALPWHEILVQPFEPTNDPTVIGIKPIPNIQERIRKKLQQYIDDTDIQDVELDEADFDMENLFKQPEHDE